MDYESSASRALGSWDPKTQLTAFYDKWSSDADGEAFVVDAAWRDMVARLGFSGSVPDETLAFWDATLREVYSGDEGRRKLRLALLNLLERDGLLARTRDVRCPVYWLHVSLSLPFHFAGNPLFPIHGYMRTSCIRIFDMQC